jgi:hypothetical protein
MRTAAICLLVGCGSEPLNPADVTRDPAADGPWRVGVTTIEARIRIVKMLTIEIWYRRRRWRRADRDSAQDRDDRDCDATVDPRRAISDRVLAR